MSRTLAALFALSATPALAELTAEEVLAEHLNLLSGYGLIEVQTTGTTKQPDSIAVDGVLGTYEDDDTRVEIATPGMVLTERSDGTVVITYPDVIEVTVTASPKDEETRAVTLALNTTGLVHEVSGSLEDLTHRLRFDTLSLGDFTAEPPLPVEEFDLTMDFAIAGFDSTVHLDTRDITRRNVEVSFAGLTMAGTALMAANIGLDVPGTTYDSAGVGESVFNIALSDVATRVGYIGEDIPRHSLSTKFGQMSWQQKTDMGENEGAFDLSMNTSDFAVSYDVTFEFESFDENPLDAILAGQNASGAFNFASLAYDFTIDTPEGAVASATSSGASENRFTFGENGLAFFSNTVDSVAEMGLPGLGLPIKSAGYSVAKSMIDLALPLTPSEAQQPFRMNMALEGVTVEDSLWSLFDPDGRIPRDPADLVIEMDGSTVVAENPYDDATEMPFANFRASLNKLRLNMAGAEVTGDGSVIDTSNGGKPSGIGELNLRLKGINTLIDTVVDMGLLPNEQAMGARMGLSLIARPEGPDELVSKIEINEAGEIYANGQRIK